MQRAISLSKVTGTSNDVNISVPYETKRKPQRYWGNRENIDHFLSQIKVKYNLNTPEDWNSITTSHIQSNGGRSLLSKYSIYELKCMACPEGKSIFNNARQANGNWENQEYIQHFLSKIKQKYNLNTPEDWNSITTTHIKSNGGSSLLSKYSIYELKCMACKDGKLIFNNPPRYWENKENILQFLSQLKQKYNFNTPEDWNSITHKHIKSNGGRTLLLKHSMYELKCLACPEGKSTFNNSRQTSGYWENKENILLFFSKLKHKYNLQTPEDWNSITKTQIISNGGRALLAKYSMYELKCLACPEGKLNFNNPPGFWDSKENILQFLSQLQRKYNLNTPNDWNSITYNHIQSNGGNMLLLKYSMYDLKCMACPDEDAQLNFKNPNQPPGFWDNKQNVLQFLSEFKQKYNLHTPDDWRRISKHQLKSEGGRGLFDSKNNYLDIKIQFDSPNKTPKFIPLSKLIAGSVHKRSSQRWLFLQIKNLFPNEEIVEDYFHSEIFRLSGLNVQFDIFMIERNIAIEYHGKQHYEDIPQAFSNVETYQYRDLEKEKPL